MKGPGWPEKKGKQEVREKENPVRGKNQASSKKKNYRFNNIISREKNKKEG